MDNCKLVHKNDRGAYVYMGYKPIFLDRFNSLMNVSEGLGYVDLETLIDKGGYGFAKITQVISEIPNDYYNVGFFKNKGVPIKVEIAKYGGSVFFIEQHTNNWYIRAYAADGTTLFYEGKEIRSEKYNGENMYYHNALACMQSREDITDEFERKILESLKDLSCTASMDSPEITTVLNKLSQNEVVILDTGLVVLNGKFESLLIWSENDQVCMAWLGRKLDLSKFAYTVYRAAQ